MTNQPNCLLLPMSPCIFLLQTFIFSPTYSTKSGEGFFSPLSFRNIPHSSPCAAVVVLFHLSIFFFFSQLSIKNLSYGHMCDLRKEHQCKSMSWHRWLRNSLLNSASAQTHMCYYGTSQWYRWPSHQHRHDHFGKRSTLWVLSWNIIGWWVFNFT